MKIVYMHQYLETSAMPGKFFDAGVMAPAQDEFDYGSLAARLERV